MVNNPEVHDSRTSRHSAHAQSQVWQIWLVLVSIYCVHKAIQKQNVVGPGQRSWFLGADQKARGLWEWDWRCAQRGMRSEHVTQSNGVVVQTSSIRKLPIGRKAVLSDLKTAFTFTPALRFKFREKQVPP